MTKQVAPPDVVGEALALREAGYITLAISQRLGMSVRTLQRHFAAGGARKGALKAEVLQRAKNELMARITPDEAIKAEAARLVADDLVHSLHLREIILAASEQMKVLRSAMPPRSRERRHTLRLSRTPPTSSAAACGLKIVTTRGMSCRNWLCVN